MYRREAQVREEEQDISSKFISKGTEMINLASSLSRRWKKEEKKLFYKGKNKQNYTLPKKALKIWILDSAKKIQRPA